MVLYLFGIYRSYNIVSSIVRQKNNIESLDEALKPLNHFFIDP